MFGIQPSFDPEYMGMTEDEPENILYYADEEDEPLIRAKVDEQYDLLKIPKRKRRYYFENEKDYGEYETSVLGKKVWLKVRAKNKRRLKKHKDEIHWAGDNNDEVLFQKRNRAIALARIRLGVVILSDIKDTGECSLEAET